MLGGPGQPGFSPPRLWDSVPWVGTQRMTRGLVGGMRLPPADAHGVPALDALLLCWLSGGAAHAAGRAGHSRASGRGCGPSAHRTS